jgi:tRNA(Ile)-lysidine synthase
MGAPEPVLLDRVIASISRYSMFTPGARVALAVSGGADSVALLHLLVELGHEWELKLAVVHVNHGLRGAESDADERFVAELAAAASLPFHARPVDVRAGGGNLEETAREARRKVFREMLGRVADCVATGHTRDDQAETVLFRILRGTGPRGLTGILPVTPDGVVRPLLAAGREELRAWLVARGHVWREDSSNADPQFTRNRLRHDLLPALARDWNPRVSEALARLAVLAGEDEQVLVAEARQAGAACMRVEPGGLLLDCDELSRLPPGLARRVVRQAVEQARGSLRQVEYEHIEALLALAAGRRGTGSVRLPGLEARRSFGWLRLEGPGEGAGGGFQVALTPPCRVVVPVSGEVLELEVIQLKDSESGYNTNGFELDWDRLPDALELRSFRPGDRYQPMGAAGAVKIKHLFQRAGIPAWDRGRWPVVTSGGQIVWVKRFGPAAGYERQQSTRNVLRIRSGKQLGVS